MSAEPTQALLPPPVQPETNSFEKLPASAVAVMEAVGASASQSVEAHSNPAPAVNPVSPPADVGRVIGSLTAETKVAPASSKPVPVAAPVKQVEPFVLSCWWLGEELLAVDSREPGTALPVESLFSNIARALGWHQLPTERDKLKWPLAENPFASAAGASDARDTCSSWLEAACGRKAVKSIWLMGEQAQSFCSPVPLEDSVNDWQGTSVVAMPSLTQLLNDPSRKRDVWQLLRKLYPQQTRSN